MLHGVYTVLQVCMSTVRYVHVQFGAYICAIMYVILARASIDQNSDHY